MKAFLWGVFSRRTALITIGLFFLPFHVAAAKPQKDVPPDKIKTYLVDFQATISTETTGRLQEFLSKVANSSPGSEAYIVIATRGGDAVAASNTYTYLRALPLKLVTVALGATDSAGIAVFLSGDRRIVTDASSFLFHAPFEPVTEADMTVDDVKDKLEFFLNARNRTSQIYAERMNISLDAATELQLRQNIFGPKAALSKGIATEYIATFEMKNLIVYTISDIAKNQ